MHSWQDRTECYARRLYPMRQGSQVWARGSGLVKVKKDQVARGDVSGVMGLTGETRGTISVSFIEETHIARGGRSIQIKDYAGETL